MESSLCQSSVASIYWCVWELDDPPTGSNTVSITLSTGNWNPISSVCYSFTGCSGVGNTNINTGGSNPQTTSVAISENSMIIGAGYSGTGGSSVEIPQSTSRTIDWNSHISNYHFGGISPSLISGTKTIEVGAGGNCNALAFEVQEAAAASSRRVIIIN